MKNSKNSKFSQKDPLKSLKVPLGTKLTPRCRLLLHKTAHFLTTNNNNKLTIKNTHWASLYSSSDVPNIWHWSSDRVHSVTNSNKLEVLSWLDPLLSLTLFFSQQQQLKLNCWQTFYYFMAASTLFRLLNCFIVADMRDFIGWICR